MNLHNQTAKKILRQQLPGITAFVYGLLFIQAWWQNKNVLLIIGCFACYVVFNILSGKKRSAGATGKRSSGVRRSGQSDYSNLEDEHHYELERQRERDRELDRQRENDRDRERERQRDYERRYDD